ncbi:Hsp70 family protein [uncultured Paludibaculum sp.]|uniref:Hsp70 family protein n=1 Tax=uncultured Paludibaculum sp. TaxID=1765020 RepID=UPI002AAC15C5|nr:Hsp70 family protein [uncultured Paludibaculum sp.]
MRFLGIDLGTTNCGFASTSADADAGVELFHIPQLTNPGEVQAEPLLESALYLARDGEFADGALDLPWLEGNRTITGRLAARRGVETLGRLVTSAKSWLSYTGADRTAAILPVNAPDGAPRVSPVEASQRYLEHLKAAWDFEHPDVPFEQQHVVLTVPASFDEVARQLTQKAAEQAGFKNLILLEEPQAAFYAWLERHDNWRENVEPGDLVLVIDVGGGTTDLTLITVTEKDGALQLERVAVGDHLLLGGDNMDLALAHSAAARMGKLDSMQFHALWQQCRLAKENLLSNDEMQDAPLTILGRGSSLIGGTIKGKLTRAEVEALLVDGFFPVVSSHDMPARQRRSGLMEVGLPYEPDAAITRHLARFLRRDGAGMACPTHVLFNGGVFRAGHLRKRLIEVLNQFLAEEGKPPVTALEGDDLMHAVARGAAYYGRAREGRGIRIRGGVPRTYYIGIESAMPAVPGFAAPMKALTVVPFGMEEGTGAKVPNREFALIVGEPAEFRFFSSSARKHDDAGTLLEEIDADLEEIAPIQVHLEGEEGQMVRVSLETHVTETGVLELWCVARDGRRWKLEFQVREAGRKRNS